LNRTSTLLKAALFATGLAGIVAEYTISTLATYFLGDSVFQWTMIVSIMLFSMGLGSRISKSFEENLLEKFVGIEFILSLVASNVTVIVYVFFALYGNTLFIIYLLSIIVGLLIGMEIPIVIRLNERFDTLKVNISSALENDYYGSLAGGIFFAFIGLPYLGLVYTPLVLGSVNFAVAILLMMVIWGEINSGQKRKFVGFGVLVAIVLGLSAMFSKNIVQWGDRIRYKDLVVYSEQSRYQKIVLTYSEGDYWLFLNGHQQLSTLDEALYHEPLVHSVMQLHNNPKAVLVLGGGDGVAVRELLKYKSVEDITLVDLDPSITDMARNHPVMLGINGNSLNQSNVTVINQDGFNYLESVPNKFDVVIADFPDPRTVDLGRLYSREFYWLVNRALRADGIMITQAGSPYYAERAFECIDLTIQAAGFQTLRLHNQVLSLGEWGWVIGTKENGRDLQKELQSATLGNIETQWITDEAFTRISSFGKTVFEKDYEEVAVNRLHDPVLYRYYLDGRWDLY
jgi:spermidine synthase